MKTKKMIQKLALNKVTVTNLNGLELGKVKGGLPPAPNTQEGECLPIATESCNCTYLLECTWTCATVYLPCSSSPNSYLSECHTITY